MTCLLPTLEEDDCSTRDTSIEVTKPLSLSSGKSQSDSLRIYTWDDLRRVNLLGRGTYADVYHMVDNTSPSRRNYAVKFLSEKRMEGKGSSEFATARADLKMEASILSQLDHENIIKLRGISANSEEEEQDHDAFLLFDILQETLKERLDRWRKQQGPRSKKRKSSRAASLDTLLSRVHRMRGSKDHVNIDKMYSRMQSVALEVVKAMTYLHRNEFLLRDLKPANIGFTADGHVQLFDFGFARHIDNCSPDEVAGTPRFLAPEVLEGEGYSFASDVYSFGVLLHELCTLEASSLSSASCQVSLDSIPCRATKELVRVCLSKRAKDRPSFAVIEKTLNNILLEVDDS
jgi:serine/threonine protein kinase